MTAAITLLGRTYLPGDQDFSGDCDYVILRLDKETIHRLLGYMAKAKRAAQKDSRFLTVRYRDHSVAWYDDNALEHITVPDSELYDGNWREIPPVDEKVLQTCRARTVDESVTVWPDMLEWRAFPKHCDFRVTSCLMSVKDLNELARRCVNCGKAADEHQKKKCLFGPTTYAPFAK